MVFVLPYQLTRYYATPLLDLAKISQATQASARALALGWALLFAVYYLGYRLCPARPSTRFVALLSAFPVLFSLILLWMYPVGAADIFDQAFRGHLFARYGANPFTTVPATFANDPLYPYIAWKGTPVPYGPLWELLAGFTSWLSRGNLLALLLAYKLLVMAHFWGGMALVYATLLRYQPDHAARGLWLYAWNPLLLFEVAGNGHNDALLIFWMLAAVYALVCRRPVLALLALTAGVLVKFIPALLAPLFLVALWQLFAGQSWRYRLTRVLLALAAVAALTALLYLPFGLRMATTILSNRNQFFTASVPRLVLFWLHDDAGMPDQLAQRLIRNGALALVLLAVGWQTLRLLRLRAPEHAAVVERVARGGYEILFLYLLVASLWFQPWYITWLLAFAPFLSRPGYAARTVLFCLTAIGNYFVWDYFLFWAHFDYRAVQTAAVLTIYPLPFLLTLTFWLRSVIVSRRATTASS